MHVDRHHPSHLARGLNEAELAQGLILRKRDIECVVEDASGRKWDYLELYTREPIDSEADDNGHSGPALDFDIADTAGGGGDYAIRNGESGGESAGARRFERFPDLCAIDSLSLERAAPGTTALRLAASRGYTSLVMALLEEGRARPEIAYDLPDAFGRRALHDVARSPFLAR